jgi:hypothetical protein
VLSGKESLWVASVPAKKHPFPNQPFRLVAFFLAAISSQEHYTEILCKRISWIVAQTIARQLVSVVKTSICSVRCRTLLCETLNGIGALNGAVHPLGKGIKGQQVLFILNQASYRFWIALSVLGW